MATFTIFDEFPNNLGLKKINMSTDTFKAALTNTAPTQDVDDTLSDITQITATGGYVTGGSALTSVAWAETGAGTGIWQFTSADVSFTASGTDIATHRYLVIYSDTATNDELVGYVDRGSSAVITLGNTRTWDVGANGWFQVTTTP